MFCDVPTIVLCFILDQKARDLVNNTIQAKNLRKQTQALFLIGKKPMSQLQRLGGKRTHFSAIDFFIQAYKQTNQVVLDDAQPQ